jgi:hypothetical protein
MGGFSRVRKATEELEAAVRRLTITYQRGLEDAYSQYSRALVDAFNEGDDGDAPPEQSKSSGDSS